MPAFNSSCRIRTLASKSASILHFSNFNSYSHACSLSFISLFNRASLILSLAVVEPGVLPALTEDNRSGEGGGERVLLSSCSSSLFSPTTNTPFSPKPSLTKAKSTALRACFCFGTAKQPLQLINRRRFFEPGNGCRGRHSVNAPLNALYTNTQYLTTLYHHNTIPNHREIGRAHV